MATERRSFLRRGSDHETGIDLELLTLLRETFQNNFEASITLLERQEILNNKMERLLTDLAKVCGNQTATAAEVNKLPSHMKALVETLRTDEAKEHASLKLQIYAAFGVLGALTIALVGLLVKIWPRIPIPYPGP